MPALRRTLAAAAAAAAVTALVPTDGASAAGRVPVLGLEVLDLDVRVDFRRDEVRGPGTADHSEHHAGGHFRVRGRGGLAMYPLRGAHPTQFAWTGMLREQAGPVRADAFATNLLGERVPGWCRGEMTVGGTKPRTVGGELRPVPGGLTYVQDAAVRPDERCSGDDEGLASMSSRVGLERLDPGKLVFRIPASGPRELTVRATYWRDTGACGDDATSREGTGAAPGPVTQGGPEACSSQNLTVVTGTLRLRRRCRTLNVPGSHAFGRHCGPGVVPSRAR